MLVHLTSGKKENKEVKSVGGNKQRFLTCRLFLFSLDKNQHVFFSHL